LHNQIIERKVIELVLNHATFKDVPFTPPEQAVEAVDLTLGGGDMAEIPEAAQADESRPLPQQKDHT
jgi:hypothetical protein